MFTLISANPVFLLDRIVDLRDLHPIPFIATKAYEILVPCPEPGGAVTSMEPTDPSLFLEYTFMVDAREKTDCGLWNFHNAMCVTYDYLDPTPATILTEVSRQIAKSKAQRVIVYGDGQRPDTGEQLGKEISGYGIKNVFFVKGGAPALRRLQKSGGGQ